MQEILTRINKGLPTDKMCTLFYEQAVYERGTKW